jgi:serine/threonine-protein kinase
MSDPLDRLTAALADRYAIERELGAGGMATVYLAEDLKHQRQVAIKVLRPELTAALGAERFLREITTTANLHHPHILPLYDSGEAQGFLYYVMPYVEGESLRDRLRREKQLPLEDALGIAREVADALGYAHDRGIVHRDIKPENILLEAGHALVADFGIARAVSAAGTEKLTATGTAIGTPVYMSPEQASGERDLDGRSDLYSLGCVVYEMLGGEPPYMGTTPQAVIAKKLSEPTPRISVVRERVPHSVEAALDQALAKSPADRYATAGAFAEGLTTATAAPRAGVRGWRRAATVLAGVVVLALAARGLASLLAGERIETLAVLPLTDLTNDPEQEFLAAGVHEALISELGRLGLSITARRTMVQYRDSDKPISEIAREVGADAVVEGSLYRSGDSLEIATRLYDKDEQELWTASHGGVLSDVVALYRGFARAIAGEIGVRLSTAEQERLNDTPAVNPEVFEAYLRGMHILNNRRTRKDANVAIDYFNQALEQNPADPLAYAGLALAYATLGHGFDPPDDAWPRARAAAERALRLDSTLAEAWAALADCKSYGERDWEGAERAFRRANELNPSLAMNHYHYAWYLALFGRVEEALAEHRRAQELDPLTPLHTTWLPAVYWFSEDYERALPLARENVERYDPGIIAHYVLGETLARMGRYEEAIATHEKLATIFPRWSYALALTYARAGRTEDTRRILEQFEAQPPSSWVANGLARMHAALGNRDEALHWLEYEPAHGWVAWAVAWNSGFEPYRDDPRFQAIVRRMNLELVPGERAPVALPPIVPPLAGAAGTAAEIAP